MGCDETGRLAELDIDQQRAMIDEHRAATGQNEQPLHLRWQVHVGFWLGYVLYRSLVGGVWQGHFVQLWIELLDLPVKIAVSYLAVLVLLRQFRARRWFSLTGTALTALIATAVFRQGLWHWLIYPSLLPHIVHEPGFFELPDLASNLSSIYPVVTMMVLAWLASSARASAGNLGATPGAPDSARLRVQLGSRAEQVDHADIQYLAADRDYVNVILDGRQLRMRVPLKQVLAQLPTPPFVRVHRRYLINLDHVTAHSASQVRVAHTWLPVGRTHRSRIREFLR